MPTVGWIREDALEAFYEGTERIDDPGPPPAPIFSCPFCPATFPDRKELQDHVSGSHQVDRPLLLIAGREAERRTVVRSMRRIETIEVANATSAQLIVDGGSEIEVALADLPSLIASRRQADFRVLLSNQIEARAAPATSVYDISVRIADAKELRDVEKAFFETILPRSLSISAIDRFLAHTRCTGAGQEYAAALAEYSLGVILKERPDTELLTTPFARYRDAYGSALRRLSDIERPLALLIACTIRFAFNDFSKTGRRSGFWELDLASALLSDPTAPALPAEEGKSRRPICPVDHGIGSVLDLAARMSRQTRWSPILTDDCRTVANAPLLDVTDRQKALAIWALAAWRLNAKGSAIEPLRQISATYPFRSWAEPYLESLAT